MQKYTAHHITFLSILLSMLIVTKYIFSFVVGIEFISFLFILYALFLKWQDLTLLITSFNLLCLAMHGFHPFWIMYWIIWPLSAFGAKLIFKTTRNRFAISLWGFFMGLSLLGYEFVINLIFYDKAFAFASILSAIPINLIEGFTTMFALILLAPPILNAIHQQKNFKLIMNITNDEFKPLVYKRLGYISTITMATISVIAVPTLFATNHFFGTRPNPPNQHINFVSSNEKIQTIYNTLSSNEIIIAIIDEENTYTQKINIINITSLEEAIFNDEFEYEFEYDIYPMYGKFLKQYKSKKQETWLPQNSNIYHYPKIKCNNSITNLGISSWNIQKKDVYEFIYEKK